MSDGTDGAGSAQKGGTATSQWEGGSCLGIGLVPETRNDERNGALGCGNAPGAIRDYGSEIDDRDCPFVTDGKRGIESENVSTNSSVSLHSVCGYSRVVYALRYASVDGPLRVWS